MNPHADVSSSWKAVAVVNPVDRMNLHSTVGAVDSKSISKLQATIFEIALSYFRNEDPRGTNIESGRR
ncbi:MAG: hypothetical protein BGO01_10185 [Armatimonadetes bacterium 55-13]|nr:MAG: hypothetical protein BGO01_10185 [Armatimonadetes bacterium 55-13]